MRAKWRISLIFPLRILCTSRIRENWNIYNTAKNGLTYIYIYILIIYILTIYIHIIEPIFANRIVVKDYLKMLHYIERTEKNQSAILRILKVFQAIRFISHRNFPRILWEKSLFDVSRGIIVEKKKKKKNSQTVKRWRRISAWKKLNLLLFLFYIVTFFSHLLRDVSCISRLKKRATYNSLYYNFLLINCLTCFLD